MPTGTKGPPSPRTRRVALVTGAGTRVGRAIALHLARHGWTVAAHYQAHRPPPRLAALRADLSSPDGPDLLASAFRRRFRRLALLVCSAAVFKRRPLERTDAAFFDAQMALNARAPLLLARALLPLLRRSGGSVVNVAEVGGAPVPWAGYSAYGASKAALRAVTEALALELAPRVRVNAFLGRHGHASKVSAMVAGVDRPRYISKGEFSQNRPQTRANAGAPHFDGRNDGKSLRNSHLCITNQ